ncbi:hypothetical protein [Kribbella solani]|uniref:Thioredoxin n=1 Tax=Kribbella solani TaxID=236067 RepID=A0A841E4G5_9ACTN|nr:hypothetical protein [Kribbella solani]MBB5983830.1 hypothetical protein [Kribbella solani]
MVTVLLIVVCLLIAMAFVLLGAQIELFEQVKQLRKFLDLEDKVTDLELAAAGARPSEVGLPKELDHVETGAVLLLSNKCATCQTLAATLRGGRLPDGIWLLVVPVTGDAREFVDHYELRGDRISVDLGELTTNRLGLDVTPSAVFVEDGRLTTAQTVPSVRHLRTLPPRRAAKSIS